MNQTIFPLSITSNDGTIIDVSPDFPYTGRNEIRVRCFLDEAAVDIVLTPDQTVALIAALKKTTVAAVNLAGA